MSTTPSIQVDSERIREAVRRYWGFESLRPLQEQAIRAACEQRDSLVVMPTGGGKSLCYQAPAAVLERTDVVVSPLIALMKDQVDGLRECGYPAAALHSGLTRDEQARTEQEIASGKHRLVFVAPERLLQPAFLRLIERLGCRSFAIDEAHCISQWGHDFRPEYRQLAQLKQRFPQASIHAFTATATKRVQADIVQQLKLRDPAILVGTFDRPNLTYRIIPRSDVYAQSLEVVRRHKDQAVIAYCMSRKATEELAEYLRGQKIRAACYHAGMDALDRRKTQDAFAEEKIDVVVATVAFGMGIDRSDVRCVLHTGMPQSVEHYQQETGRAGRDGLPAECVLLYSGADPLKWQSLFEKRVEEGESNAETLQIHLALLQNVQRLCSGVTCRHGWLSEFFGQTYDKASCGACDICLGEVAGLSDATVTAQKILSCVARTGERFGVMHVVDVLRGAKSERIVQWKHDQLSTYGLLKELDKKRLTNLVFQLVDQGVLDRTTGDQPILKLNAESWKVLRGQRSVKLLDAAGVTVKKSRAEADTWEGVDAGLFEALRQLRRALAEERKVPPFMIFNDATLREIARQRPSTPEGLRCIPGVGERKLRELGQRVLDEVRRYCAANRLDLDVESAVAPPPPPRPVVSAAKVRAYELFRLARPLDVVAREIERAPSTVAEYLGDYIAEHAPRSVAPWVDAQTYRRVVEAARDATTLQLKPIFEKLNGAVPYEKIRIVLAHLNATGTLDAAAGTG